MGRRQAWFIVEATELVQLATVLDVKITGRSGSRGDFRLSARRMDGRWLVVSDNSEDPLFRNKSLAAISRLGRTFSGACEEHVMYSSFTAWGKGRKSWAVERRGDHDDPLHLKVIGKLPKEVAARKDATLEQARREGDDAEHDLLFEFPQELTREFAGLEPERDLDEGTFQELHIGFWRNLWRRTFWWRLLLLFVAGVGLFAFGMGLIAQLLRWVVDALGWS